MIGTADMWDVDLRHPFDRNRMSRDHNRTISGQNVGCSRCVGYCQFSEHPGFLTEKQRAEHNCIGKGCNYYIAKQQRSRRTKQIQEHNDALCRKIKESAAAVCEAVKILDVTEEHGDSYRVNFITVTNDYSFMGCSKQLKAQYGINVTFKKLEYDFDTCVRLLCCE